jgi:hypothetical protein
MSNLLTIYSHDEYLSKLPKNELRAALKVYDKAAGRIYFSLKFKISNWTFEAEDGEFISDLIIDTIKLNSGNPAFKDWISSGANRDSALNVFDLRAAQRRKHIQLEERKAVLNVST